MAWNGQQGHHRMATDKVAALPLPSDVIKFIRGSRSTPAANQPAIFGLHVHFTAIVPHRLLSILYGILLA